MIDVASYRARVAICPEGGELWGVDAAPSRWDNGFVPHCPNHNVDCEIHTVGIVDHDPLPLGEMPR